MAQIMLSSTLKTCNQELKMMPTINANLTSGVDMSAIDEFSHLARSSLNSLEYFTAVTLGLAQDGIYAAAQEGESIFSTKSPLDVTIYCSMSPVNALSSFSKACLQLQEATQNYYKYVNSDLIEVH